MTSVETPVFIGDGLEPARRDCSNCSVDAQSCPVVAGIEATFDAEKAEVLRLALAEEGVFMVVDLSSKFAGARTPKQKRDYVGRILVKRTLGEFAEIVRPLPRNTKGFLRFEIDNEARQRLCTQLGSVPNDKTVSPLDIKPKRFKRKSVDSYRAPEAPIRPPVIDGDPRLLPEANCRNLDLDLFFPDQGASSKVAKEACRGCVVREDCLEYALANGEKFGIWGGLTARERRRIRKQQAFSAKTIPEEASL